MALRNIWDQIQNQFVVNALDANILEIDNIPINTSGGGSTTLSNSDSSITVTPVTGGYSLSNAGQNWSTHSATSNVNLNNNNLVGATNVSIGNCTLGQSYSGPATITISNNTTTGTVFDTAINYPYISTILTKNSSALGKSLTNLNILTAANGTFSGSTSSPALAVVGQGSQNAITATGNIECDGIVNASDIQINGSSISTGSFPPATSGTTINCNHTTLESLNEVATSGTITCPSITGNSAGSKLLINSNMDLQSNLLNCANLTINNNPLPQLYPKVVKLLNSFSVNNGRSIILQNGYQPLYQDINLPNDTYNYIHIDFELSIPTIGIQSGSWPLNTPQQFVIAMGEISNPVVVGTQFNSFYVTNQNSLTGYSYELIGSHSMITNPDQLAYGLYIINSDNGPSSPWVLQFSDAVLQCTITYEVVTFQ
jgi:hypothetical protein